MKISNAFKSQVWVTKDDETVNGKSIMGLMMLAAEQGASITVDVDGEDEEAALKQISSLIESGLRLSLEKHSLLHHYRHPDEDWHSS